MRTLPTARSRTDSGGVDLRRLLNVKVLGSVVIVSLSVGVWAAAASSSGEPATEPVEGGIDPTGVSPGSGQLTAQGHRETDTQLDTWLAPDVSQGAWYAFPVPKGFAVEAPPEGTEFLLRSSGNGTRTAMTVVRLPADGDLGPGLARQVDQQRPDRTLVADPQLRTAGGVPAVVMEQIDVSAEPAMRVRTMIVDVGPDRLVFVASANEEVAEEELGLIQSVVWDNLITQNVSSEQ